MGGYGMADTAPWVWAGYGGMGGYGAMGMGDTAGWEPVAHWAKVDNGGVAPPAFRTGMAQAGVAQTGELAPWAAPG